MSYRERMNTAGREGLVKYVLAVANRLGGDVVAVDIGLDEGVATAFIMVRSYIPTLIGWRLVLSWDEANGWALRIVVNEDGDSTALAYLGGEILPKPKDVQQFVEDANRGQNPGSITAPAFRHPEERDDLEQRLAHFCR